MVKEEGEYKFIHIERERFSIISQLGENHERRGRTYLFIHYSCIAENKDFS